ncbi:MAG: hypothetical protein R3B90_03760 [Planctomycetaceae bacterium]
MSLRPALIAELSRLQGHAGPVATAHVSTGGGVTLSIDFLAVDTLACEFEQIVVHAPAQQSAPFDALKRWAQQLSRRISYLLEQIAPLEFDEAAGEVLVRSTPPDQLTDGTQYYEMLLHSQQGGGLALRRYRAIKGQPGRQQIPMTTTREVLLKLADDLIDSMP